MNGYCPVPGELVDIEQGRVATQYREAARFRGYLSAILDQIEDIARATCAIPTFFDLTDAVGDQLTLIGKRIGFPRCHCVCNTRPVFGFKCEGQSLAYPIAGFCEDGAWSGCGGVSDLCIGDDEVYRAHLLARRYQMLGLFDIESLGAALRHVWGATAWIPRARFGKVVLAPGRDLTTAETQRLSVTLRALPIAPGIGIAVHFGPKRVAGFGTGWAGFCDEIPSQPVFGFPCSESEASSNPRPVVGFCQDGVWSACAPPIASAGQWLCPVDIDPYGCGEDTVGPPVHGFRCPDSADERPLTGFCETGSTWAACLLS